MRVHGVLSRCMLASERCAGQAALEGHTWDGEWVASHVLRVQRGCPEGAQAGAATREAEATVAQKALTVVICVCAAVNHWRGPVVGFLSLQVVTFHLFFSNLWRTLGVGKPAQL